MRLTIYASPVLTARGRKGTGKSERQVLTMNSYHRHGNQTAVPCAGLQACDALDGPNPHAFGILPARLPRVPHAGPPLDPRATVPAPLEFAGLMDADPVPAQQMCIEGMLSRDAFDHVLVGALARITLKGPALRHYSSMTGEVVQVDLGRARVYGQPFRCCHVRVVAASSFFVDGNTYYPLLPDVAVRMEILAASRTFYPIMQTVRQWLS